VTDRLALCYHALSERWPAALAVRPGQFASQLDWLAGRGYRGVTFEDLVLGPDRGGTAHACLVRSCTGAES